ncbi:MAG: glycosyltransferase family 2 protein [Bacteroidales bacterium]|nr:glycosyltransferase family 2 protein [Bacteroidales bacterium]
MRTAVVILNWNGRSMLERFLPSVTANTQAPDEVIVADNGSTDDSLEFLNSHYPQLRIIALDKNYGFAEGYNKALAQIDAQYYVLLNDDVEVTPCWIDPVIEMLESDDTIAIAQPKLLMYDQRDTFEYAGGAGGFIDHNGYPFCRGRMFNTLEKDEGQYDDSCDLFWASGAAMFVKANVWNELGGLDGDFFAHMEEIDFCWRSKNQGYRAIYCPQSIVYHVGGGTLPKSSPHKTYLNFRNNLSLLYKNLPPKRMGRVLALRMLLDGVAALKFLLEGHPQEFAAVCRAHRDYRRQKASLQAKRSQLNPHEVSCVYHGPLLLDYYLRGKKKFIQLESTRFSK